VADLDFAYRFDDRGRSAQTGYDEHIRDLVEQVLFTTPGERVNRPTFGSGLLQLVFAPNSDELANTTQFLVQGALQEWLGDRIQMESVEVENVDAILRIKVVYVIRQTQERVVAEFER